MKRIVTCLLCMCVLAPGLPIEAQTAGSGNIPNAVSPAFTSGNIVICRVGDGSGSLTSSTAAVFLDEYTPDGTFVSSTAMPTANAPGQAALTVGGTSVTECQMTRSTDGRYLVLVGYPFAPGNSISSTGGRVLGRVDSAGNVDTSTITSSFGSSFVRGAATTDGTGFWVTGAGTAGVVYKLFGTTGPGTIVSSTFTNLRGVNIFAGQLFTSSNASTYRLGAVGTGTPTTTGNTAANLPGQPSGMVSPNAFFFADLDPGVAGLDTLYVADDGGTGTTLASGGIKKFSLVSGSWVFNGNFPGSGAVTASAFAGVTGVVSGSQVTLFATRNTGQLVRYVDTTGYNGIPTAAPTLLVTAAANTSFRGVALAPVQPVVLPNLSINDVSQSEGNAGTTAYTFTVTLSAAAPAGGVTFDIATADGTAQDGNPGTEDADYTANSLTGQTIAAGATSFQFTVNVNGDGTNESNESYFVNVTNVAGANVSDGQGQGTLVNDDLGTTAGPVSVAGRVLTREGRGIANASVSLVDGNGVRFVARTNTFGYYGFAAVTGGESYVMAVTAKKHRFAPQLVTAVADVTWLNVYPER